MDFGTPTGCRSNYMETDAAPEAPAPGDGAPAGAEPAPRKLSVELAELRHRFAERTVTLEEVIAVLRGRAYLLLIILLALPFCAPVSPPGLSTPLGLVIALISLRLALGQRPWLPRRLRHWELPSGLFQRAFGLAERVIRFLETFLRPRVPLLATAPGLRNLHAVLMLLAGVFLMLPLPLPFTNTVPAWVIVLIAAGLLERDAVFLAVGYALFAAGVAVFVLLGGATHHLLQAARLWFGH